MAVRFRTGNPADADFLAWMILVASRAHLTRGLWDIIIGSDEGGRLDYLSRLAIAESKSLYHCENFLIAEVDGAPAAALCGFETSGAWEMVGVAMASVQSELGWADADAAASYQRVAPIWTTCMPPDIGADFAIENVATLPQYRRRGLANALIEEMLRSATKRGCKLAQITSFIGNAAAQSVYQRAGFKVFDEKRCTEAEKLLGVPGFLRMTRLLKID